MEMSVMSALLLLLAPPFSALLAVAARSLAEFAGSWSPMRKLIIGNKASPEQQAAAAARDEQLRVARYGGGGESPSAAECAVCLGGIDEGDEVRELRCRHLFHRGCLDRWLLMARPPATCPLCRCRLLTSAAAEDDGGGEDEESDMVLFMAYMRSSSTWL